MSCARAAQVASEPGFEFMWDEIMMKLNCLKGSSLTSCDEFPVEHVPLPLRRGDAGERHLPRHAYAQEKANEGKKGTIPLPLLENW